VSNSDSRARSYGGRQVSDLQVRLKESLSWNSMQKAQQCL
jgi:hypothetical protein